jgi:hypothetical protein
MVINKYNKFKLMTLLKKYNFVYLIVQCVLKMHVKKNR